jgi:hypothetical protein
VNVSWMFPKTRWLMRFSSRLLELKPELTPAGAMMVAIDAFTESRSQPTLAEALHVERLIREHLPGEVRSHANVTEWLLEGHNWHK